MVFLIYTTLSAISIIRVIPKRSLSRMIEKYGNEVALSNTTKID